MKNKITLLSVAALIIIASGYFIITGSNAETPSAITETSPVAEMAAETDDGTHTNAEEQPSEITEVEQQAAVSSAEFNLEQALTPRSMGNPDAPVVIEDFSSLTCPHCASFHTSTLPALKEKYIDTGKVYLIFADFPLNAPALEASSVARCLPEERYFRFINFLFETQDKWAFDRQYSNYLRQNARLMGLSEDAYNTCLQEQGLKEGLAANMRALSEKHDITSTPTFIINGRTKITGSQPFSVFESAIEAFLEQGEQAAE